MKIFCAIILICAVSFSRSVCAAAEPQAVTIGTSYELTYENGMGSPYDKLHFIINFSGGDLTNYYILQGKWDKLIRRMKIFADEEDVYQDFECSMDDDAHQISCLAEIEDIFNITGSLKSGKENAKAQLAFVQVIGGAGISYQTEQVPLAGIAKYSAEGVIMNPCGGADEAHACITDQEVEPEVLATGQEACAALGKQCDGVEVSCHNKTGQVEGIDPAPAWGESEVECSSSELKSSCVYRAICGANLSQVVEEPAQPVAGGGDTQDKDAPPAGAFLAGDGGACALSLTSSIDPIGGIMLAISMLAVFVIRKRGSRAFSVRRILL